MIRSRAQDGLPPIEITCFYEELPLPGVGVVVPSHSAILPGYIPIVIHKNHMDTTKFQDLNDPGFVAVAGELRRWSKELAQSQGPTAASGNEPPEKMTSQSKTVHQGLPADLYRGIPITNIPQAIAQHFPQSNVGQNERKLLKAAGKGDLAEIERLIQAGAHLSAINEDRESALIRAISKKHNNVAKLLLDNGATTDYAGPLVQKPLHIAVQTGNVKMVELLLDHGADIDEMTAHGSVLVQAIRAGREEVTSILLSRHADVNLAKYPTQSPLGNAVLRKDERLIKILSKFGADPSILQDNLFQKLVPTKLSESCRGLLRDWQAQGYEEQVRIVRSPSSDTAEKEATLRAALACALEHRQQEIHSLLMELALELDLLGKNLPFHDPRPIKLTVNSSS